MTTDSDRLQAEADRIRAELKRRTTTLSQRQARALGADVELGDPDLDNYADGRSVTQRQADILLGRSEP
ncbi:MULTISPECIES: hypothetical protein [unclassified Agrococcus]|uniref:hypothetical protein n=1 Tax=unclassified Agrococcus TaxID=2615065 RepID=UPI0036239EE7